MRTNCGMRIGWIAGLCVLLAGIGTVRGATNTWTGNGDLNNSGIWSDPNNWGGVLPGTNDSAALTDVTANGNDGIAARTVTNDAVTTVRELLFTQSNGSFPNQLVLNADLSVGRVYASPDSDAGVNACRINVNGKTLTVGLYDLKSLAGGGRGIPYCSGTGTIVKVGTNEVGLSYNPWIAFTGTYRVDNGTLVGNYARIQGSILVNTGATHKITASSGEDRPFTLNGFGYSSNGAYWIADTVTKAAGITLASDASINVNASKTLTFNGTLGGTGVLTKVGSGKMLVSGNNNSFSNGVIVVGGTFEISGLMQNSAVTVKTNATLVAPAYRVGGVTVESGGTWSNSATPVWIAGTSFDGNDNGVWSNPANWAIAAVPTNLAILGNVSGNGNDGTADRTVTNTSPASVVTLEMDQTTAGFNNKLRLTADFAANTVVLNPDTDAARQVCFIDLNGQNLTLGSNDTQIIHYPQFAGGGEVFKTGTNQACFSYSPGFTWSGRYNAMGGVTYLNYSRNSGTRYRVGAGGTLRLDNTTILTSVPDISIEGSGYAGLGALWVSDSFTLAVPLIVTNAATLNVATGKALTMTGTLRGNGVTTLIGGGTNYLSNTWTFAISGSSANSMVARTGTVAIAGCTLTVTNLTLASEREYVVIDYNWTNGTVVGQFAATNGLTGSWFLTSTGTKAHPNAVVVALPPPSGTVFRFR